MVRRIVKKKPRKKLDLVNEIMEFEQKGLPPKREKKLFQNLVNSGMAFTLQGAYGRQATAMIRAGIIKPRKKKK